MMRSSWLWPTIIVLSIGAVSLTTFVMPVSPMRPIVVMWFLFICPGMALVRLLRLNEPVVEWTLAIALSFTIDAIVAGIQLYAGRWSPTLTLEILIALSFAGVIMKLATMHSRTPYRFTLVHGRHCAPIKVLLRMLILKHLYHRETGSLY